MGVPGFFAWLLRKYRENRVIIPSLDDDKKVNSLFIDANCLFHPQCFKVLGHLKDWKSKDKLEDKMIKRILNYIDYLIDFTSPTDLVMISVDGVAPAAKMSQQRKRRFRSLPDARERNEIREKYGLFVGKEWSNIVITPGTIFMEKLHKEINKYIKRRTDVKFLYSSYHSNGEGEHKILKYIRNAMKTDKKQEGAYVVYGLDADLIFLTIASQRKNMYLLREYDQFQKNSNPDEIEDIVEDVEEELRYVSIDEMKLLFFDYFKNKAEKIGEKIKGRKFDLDKLFSLDKVNDILNDFVVICFFLGNDFLPHIPSIDIQVNGLDMVIEAYLNTYLFTNKHLVVLKPSPRINKHLLLVFLNYISKREDYYFKNILPKYERRLNSKRFPGGTPYDRELWEIENMRCFNVPDPIQLGNGDMDIWKHRYYSNRFKITGDQKSIMKNVSNHFLRGVSWVLKYYFEGCPSWSWSYPYLYAPFVSDLSNTLRDKAVDINGYKFKEDTPLSPCEQLLAVLPPECNYLLPSSYKKLVTSIESPIIDLYPEEVNLDMLGQSKYWKCISMIPNVDVSRIKEATAGLKLTKAETIRNRQE
jgi:5'-3' exonuclease